MKNNVFRTAAAAALCLVAAATTAKDFSTTIDLAPAQPLARVPKKFPGFGYVCDPKVGGEETVLEYRHSGAWVLKTKVCDDKTLEFLTRNRISILLVLDGSREKINADLRRIADGNFGPAIAGFQLGDQPDGDGDAEKWRAVVSSIRRQFKDTPIAIPAADAKPPMAKMLADRMRDVSKLVYDFSKVPAPYKQLKEITKTITFGGNKDLKRMRLWVIAPDRMPGSDESTRSDFKTISWKIHWMMSAYAVEAVDAVLFNQPMQPDEFGYTLRYLGLAFRDHGTVLTHGESASADAAKSKNSSPDLEQDFDDLTGGFGGEDNMKIVASPKACANLADGKTGDVEYLALANESDRLCLVMVNTSGKRTRYSVETKGKKTGNCTIRRMYLDPETKKVKREAFGGYGQPGLPYTSYVEPDAVETVTLILTDKKHNQAGY